jgi:hypothetical protein
MRPRASPALPASIPRDRLLETMRKHEPMLRNSLVQMDTHWIKSRNVIRVSFDFDIAKYLEQG